MVQVSIQAFLDEVATWELTLQRESKKLKQLKKISKNIFQINSIDITTVEIESELIQYKKIKDKVVLSSPRSIKIASVWSKTIQSSARDSWDSWKRLGSQSSRTDSRRSAKMFIMKYRNKMSNRISQSIFYNKHFLIKLLKSHRGRRLNL